MTGYGSMGLGWGGSGSPFNFPMRPRGRANMGQNGMGGRNNGQRFQPSPDIGGGATDRMGRFAAPAAFLPPGDPNPDGGGSAGGLPPQFQSLLQGLGRQRPSQSDYMTPPMPIPGRGGRGIGRGGFDMSRIFRGLPPDEGAGYGSGGERNFNMPWTNAAPPEEKPPEETGPSRTGPDPWHGEGDGGGGGNRGDNGRGIDGGNFGDWAGRMGEMARDISQGAYQGDSAYSGGPGTGPSADAPQGAEGDYNGGGQGGDYRRGGIARRKPKRFEGGGDVGAQADDIRGGGRDVRSFDGLSDFFGDEDVRSNGRALRDMAMVGSPSMIGATLATGNELPGGEWGGYDGSQNAGGTENGGSNDRGGGMNRNGGVIRRNMGGIGYAVGGEGDGRSDEIPALLSDGEHVIPADVVSGIGRGSTKAGHTKLNDMILKQRAKYKKTLGKLPPPKG